MRKIYSISTLLVLCYNVSVAQHSLYNRYQVATENVEEWNKQRVKYCLQSLLNYVGVRDAKEKTVAEQFFNTSGTLKEEVRYKKGKKHRVVRYQYLGGTKLSSMSLGKYSSTGSFLSAGEEETITMIDSVDFIHKGSKGPRLIEHYKKAPKRDTFLLVERVNIKYYKKAGWNRMEALDSSGARTFLMERTFNKAGKLMSITEWNADSILYHKEFVYSFDKDGNEICDIFQYNNTDKERLKKSIKTLWKEERKATEHTDEYRTYKEGDQISRKYNRTFDYNENNQLVQEIVRIEGKSKYEENRIVYNKKGFESVNKLYEMIKKKEEVTEILKRSKKHKYEYY